MSTLFVLLAIMKETKINIYAYGGRSMGLSDKCVCVQQVSDNVNLKEISSNKSNKSNKCLCVVFRTGNAARVI